MSVSKFLQGVCTGAAEVEFGVCIGSRSDWTASSLQNKCLDAVHDRTPPPQGFYPLRMSTSSSRDMPLLRDFCVLDQKEQKSTIRYILTWRVLSKRFQRYSYFNTKTTNYVYQ